MPSDIRVYVRLNAVDFTARCDCGAPIAVHHHVLTTGQPLDLTDVAQFISDAYHAHVDTTAGSHDAAHHLRILLTNPDVTTSMRPFGQI